MKHRQFNLPAIRGFSLPELMIAMTIGLIIMAAVSTLFVSSKQTYTTQDQLARLQENARFAMQFIMSDLRLAGYYGCLDDIDDKNVFSVVNSTSMVYTIDQAPVEGLENAAGTWYPSGITDLPSSIKAGTDALVIRKAEPGLSQTLTARMANKTDVLTVTNTAGFEVGNIILVADCTRAELMQITAVTPTTIAHAPGGADATKTPPWPGNKNPADLSKEYDIPAKIMKFSTQRYYIRNNAAGVPSLYRDINGGTPQELVEGIEMLQVLYGVDTDNPLDGIPNRYVTASSVGTANTTYGWNAVATVRVGIVARTVNDRETDIDSLTYDADGDGNVDLAAQNDRNKRRIFQSTVQLRNML